MNGLKDAYTTQEVAGILGCTVQSINRRAARESWQSRPRAGRGGGHEWLLASMPEKTRLAVIARLCPPEPVVAVETGATLPPTAERRAAARAAALQAFTAWAASHPGRPRSQADRFSALWAAGEIPAQPWVREALPDFCGMSLLNWRKTVETAGTVALAGKYGNRKGMGVIESNPQILDTLKGMIFDKPHALSRYFYDGLKTRFPGISISRRRVQDWLKQWKKDNHQFYLSLVNADKFRSACMVAIGDASATIFRANQRWEMDGTPWDVLTNDGKRHNITGLIDVHTRRVKLLSTRTSTARAVASVLRAGMLDYGVPELVKTDNGKDYTADYTVRVMTDFGVVQELCNPFSPWEKPFIESFFHVFSHDLLEVMNGYIGHNVAEREALRARKPFAERLFSKENGARERADLEKTLASPKDGRDVTLTTAMSSAELQKFLDDWTLRYHHRPHSGLGGKTPWEAYQECLDRQEIRRIPEGRIRDLDILLLPLAPGQKGWRTVTSKGVTAGVPGHYWNDVFGAMIGQQVQIRLNEADLARAIIWDTKGHYLCDAYNSHMVGITQEDAKRAKAIQKKAVREWHKDMRGAAKRTNAADIPLEILARDVANGRMIEEQAKAEYVAEHVSPAIAEAAKAVRARTEGPGPSLTAEEIAREREKAEAVVLARAKWKAPDNDSARWREYCRIQAATAEGLDLSFEESNWARAWENSRAYKNFTASLHVAV